MSATTHPIMVKLLPIRRTVVAEKLDRREINEFQVGEVGFVFFGGAHHAGPEIDDLRNAFVAPRPEADAVVVADGEVRRAVQVNDRDYFASGRSCRSRIRSWHL